MKKFEVGERVQFIEGNEVKTGKIVNNVTPSHPIVEVGDELPYAMHVKDIAKLDQPEPVKVPEQVSKLLDTYLITKEPLDDFSKGTILADILDDYSDGVLAEDWKLADNWIGDNRTKLKDAVRNGYVVEEEPKYYVKLLPMEEGYLALNTQPGNEYYAISSPYEVKGLKTKFTETEIKAIDERLWSFAVPVEEVEAE